MENNIKTKYNIVFAASEAVPFAKTGGLADVSGALPKHLAQKGHTVSLFLPRYYCIDKTKYNCRLVSGPLSVPIGDSVEWGALYETDYLENVKTYFIEYDNYFGRSGLYDDGINAYSDNARRYTFFCRAVMQSIVHLDIKPDIIHCNDWQTALIPVYAKTFYKNVKNFKKTKTLMTIHNIGYQGVFNKNEIFWTQLGWGAYTEDNLKFFDDINFLKSSLLWSDAVTTVSRKYAEEIQTREFGYDLSGILQMRKDRLFGITNGIDYDDWNPETDKHIKASYDINNISGKSICKEDLQKTMGLPVKNNVPLFASITRVTHQKGMDILSYSLGRFLSHYDAQFVLLGSGDESILSIYDYLKNIFPDKVAIYKGYNGDLSHKIEAGADIFIMPSRYEPCGLNQMYSLKYGTVPIVRATGGLDDTVEEWNSTEKTGSGFKFIHLNEWDLEQTIIKAADAYHNSEDWKIIQQNGMSYTNSWDDAADEYIKLYHNVTKF